MMDFKLENIPPDRRFRVLMLLLDYAGRESITGLTAEDRRFIVLLADQMVDDPDGVRLDHAFGLRVRGGVSVAQRMRLDERNAILVALWRDNAEWRDLDISGAVKIMRMSFNRYAGGRWKHERSNLTPPPSEPERSWWSILDMGETLPEAKQLRRILGQDIQSGL